MVFDHFGRLATAVFVVGSIAAVAGWALSIGRADMAFATGAMLGNLLGAALVASGVELIARAFSGAWRRVSGGGDEPAT
jgi:hypothetical protein